MKVIRLSYNGAMYHIALSKNTITELAIKNTLSIPANATVKLKTIMKDTPVYMEFLNERHFALPENWNNIIFAVECVPGTRPCSPMDATVAVGSTSYIPIDIANLVDHIESYLFYELCGSIKCCFTIISQYFAISYRHGNHKEWQAGTEVIIRNQSGQHFPTNLVKYEDNVDYILVRSQVPLVSEPPQIAIPKKMERYVLIGYPENCKNYEALEGILSSIELDSYGRMRGSSGSLRGYSGGPVFNYQGELIGINVANQSAQKFHNITVQSTISDVVEEVVATFPCISVIVPALNLTHV